MVCSPAALSATDKHCADSYVQSSAPDPGNRLVSPVHVLAVPPVSDIGAKEEQAVREQQGASGMGDSDECEASCCVQKLRKSGQPYLFSVSQGHIILLLEPLLIHCCSNHKNF